MKIAEVYRNGELTGRLMQHSKTNYEFEYDAIWFADAIKPAISLTLPKTQMIHNSDCLFPCFFNMLSEGVNKKLQSRQLRIDENDYFGLLLATATNDTIGALTIKPVSNSGA